MVNSPLTSSKGCLILRMESSKTPGFWRFCTVEKRHEVDFQQTLRLWDNRIEHSATDEGFCRNRN